MSDPDLWSNPELPETWADKLSLATPIGLWTIMTAPLRGMLRRPRPVRLVPTMPGLAVLPDYLLKEFHGVPNGYYSTEVSLAYARGFELVMLQRMRPLRGRMAARLQGCDSILDVGCGVGRFVEAARSGGARDVWGLDPCPYALNIAASRVPDGRFVQGLAEDTGFSNGRFEAVGACFVLHELPAAVLDQALDEVRRVLRPGGVLVIGEPSSVHIRRSWAHVLGEYGLAGAYFKVLARLVFEPFLADWLSVDVADCLKRHGFRIELDVAGVPFREIVAVR